MEDEREESSESPGGGNVNSPVSCMFSSPEYGCFVSSNDPSDS